MKAFITLIFLTLMATTWLGAQTTTEVYVKGDTIMVRSVTVDEVAATPEQVDAAVAQITESILKAEAQVKQLRVQLAEMHKVQALVHDRKRNLQKDRSPVSPTVVSKTSDKQ